ncbi:MAG: YceD family protein [Casimicrobiaceae bacterium]
MANRTTAAGAQTRFDAFEFSADGGEIAGEIDARTLPRVVDLLAASAGPAPMAWRIAGGHDGLGRPSLTVRLDGAVPLVCQRCLQPYAAPVSQQTELLLARDGAELARLDAEETEVVLANAMLDPRTLVEDELLLSLPLSPRHAEEACAAARAFSAARPEPSPFASLAALKTRDPG